MTTTKEKKKILVFNDRATYESYKAKENVQFKIVNDLQILADASLGINQIENWVEYLNNPANYLVERYWELYGSRFNAPFADREKVYFNSSNVGIENLNELRSRFDRMQNELRNYALKINKDGVVSNLKETDFNKYLNPAMEQEYNDCLSFIEASKKMKPYYASNYNFLTRFYDGVRLDDHSELIPNYQKFI